MTSPNLTRLNQTTPNPANPNPATPNLAPMNRATAQRRLPVRAALIALTTLPLTACLMDSPYFGQTFSSTTSEVPIQTWTTDKSRLVKIECSKAYHGGLYPAFGPETWLPVADVTPSSQPSYDPNGLAAYSAGVRQALSADCWHADGAYNPPKYMTALRATQQTASGSTTVFRVFDAAGLECLGREIGKARSWGGWISPGCALNYSNSSTPLPWVKIIATSQGAASMAMARPLSLKSAPTTTALTADEMARVHADEPYDEAWAAAMEKRLTEAFHDANPQGSALLSASCRHTMCKVEVLHADAQAALEFAEALAPYGLYSGDGEHGQQYDFRSDKGSGTVYYLARDAHRLPTGPARQQP